MKLSFGMPLAPCLGLRGVPLGGLEVAKVYQSLMAKLSPETLPKTLMGLNLLVLEDRLLEGEELRGGRADEELLMASERYMRLATAAYGRVALRPGLVGVSEQNFVELLCRHVGDLELHKVSVPHAQLRARWLLPAHYVLLDRQRRELVVAVRGTLSVPDVLTDLGAEEVDLFLGGKAGLKSSEAPRIKLWCLQAHKNMLQSACNVLRTIQPLLEELLSEVERITFTGHSLGGGVAAYLAMLLPELLVSQHQVRCFSFGAPGTCCAAVSRSLRPRVVSYCHAEDVVPRLSTGHLLELHARAVRAPSAGHEASKLYPAGRCVLLRSDGAWELEPEELAPRIELSAGRRMVLDHLPRSYEQVMKAAADVAHRSRL